MQIVIHSSTFNQPLSSLTHLLADQPFIVGLVAGHRIHERQRHLQQSITSGTVLGEAPAGNDGGTFAQRCRHIQVTFRQTHRLDPLCRNSRQRSISVSSARLAVRISYHNCY